MAVTPPLLTIPFAAPLVPGRLVRRFNRFMADVELDDGRKVVAHCVNTGRMEGLTLAGRRVWLSPNDDANRSLRYTWQMVEVDGVMVGANTVLPNQMVRRLIEARLLRGFTQWSEMKPERKYGANSRIDFWLREGRREHFVEVKNCHLVYTDGRGYFPDSLSERATKHLEELIEVVRAGHRATVLFTAQRADAMAVRPSDVHDPAFAEAARRAHASGVRFRALRVVPTPEAMIVECAIPVDLKPYATGRVRGWMETNRASGQAWVTVRGMGSGNQRQK